MKNKDDSLKNTRYSLAEIKKRKARKNKMDNFKRKAIILSGLCAGVFAVLITVAVITGGADDQQTISTEIGSGVGNNYFTDDIVIGENYVQQLTDDKNSEQSSEGESMSNTDPFGDRMYIDGELVVCVDPGHGSNDVGCIGVDGTYEKNDTLMLGLYLIEELQAMGIRVVATRTTDVWVDLEDRPEYANANNADVFISIHRNTMEDDTTTRGFEAWINSENSDKSEELAGLILDGIESVGISKNRGVKKGSQASSAEDYRINAKSSMPSVILEMGFMSSYTDNQLYRQNAKAYAKAIADAIMLWSQDKLY